MSPPDYYVWRYPREGVGGGRLLGTVYIAAIAPFRHAIVYPQLMRDVEQEWRALHSS